MPWLAHERERPRGADPRFGVLGLVRDLLVQPRLGRFTDDQVRYRLPPDVSWRRAQFVRILLWILIALSFVTGALLTLSVLQTTEYDRDAYSIVR